MCIDKNSHVYRHVLIEDCALFVSGKACTVLRRITRLVADVNS